MLILNFKRVLVLTGYLIYLCNQSFSLSVLKPVRCACSPVGGLGKPVSKSELGSNFECNFDLFSDLHMVSIHMKLQL